MSSSTKSFTYIRFTLFQTYLYLFYLSFYYYHWIDTTTGGLLVPKGMIRTVASVSVLT